MSKDAGEPVTIYLPPGKKKELKTRASMYDTTMTAVLRKAALDWLMTHPAFKKDGGDVVR